MSEVVAEQLRRQEVYAASLSTIVRLGEASLSGVGIKVATELAYDDFVTKTAEMLKTDPELSTKLDIMHPKHFSVRNGKVCAADGTPMVDIVTAGLELSKNATDSRLREVQAVRDEGDKLVAEMVDELAVGESVIFVSVEPQSVLRSKDGLFWRDFGYRDGIAYIQSYSRISEEELCAVPYSVDHSDLSRWISLMRERGVDLPTDVDENTFIRHGWKFEGDVDEAAARALALRRENYEHAGASTERLSLDGYMSANEQFVRTMFDTYYPAVAAALVTGKNPPVLREFALQALYQLRPDKLEPAAMRAIIHIANSPIFNEEMARAMDELIPYALVEQLRRGLTTPRLHQSWPNERSLVGMPINEMMVYQQSMHQITLGAILAGMTAGRSYGGCSGVNLVAGDQEERGIRSLQDVYGGVGDGKSYPPGEDQYGPKTFKCTEGHVNHRPHGKLLKECQHPGCKKGSVGCS